MDRLDDGNFQINSDVDVKFDFILPDEDFSRNLGVNYARGVVPTDQEYDEIIVKGQPYDEEDVIDMYLSMNLIFDVGTNDNHHGTVVKCSRVLDGSVLGCLHTNSFFDTCQYEIELTDGTRDKYTMNLIAENTYVRVHNKGHQFQLLAEIQDRRKDGTEISKEEGKIRSYNGMKRDKITFKGWEVMVLCKDGYTY